jgi:hypothetical protein
MTDETPGRKKHFGDATGLGHGDGVDASASASASVSAGAGASASAGMGSAFKFGTLASDTKGNAFGMQSLETKAFGSGGAGFFGSQRPPASGLGNGAGGEEVRASFSFGGFEKPSGQQGQIPFGQAFGTSFSFGKTIQQPPSFGTTLADDSQMRIAGETAPAGMFSNQPTPIKMPISFGAPALPVSSLSAEQQQTSGGAVGVFGSTTSTVFPNRKISQPATRRRR